MNIVDQKWDSAFFHKKISSVILESQDSIEQWEQTLSSCKSDLIYLKFSDELSENQKEFLKSLKLDTFVTNITFEKSPSIKDDFTNEKIQNVFCTNEFLYSMVLDCGKFSRFYLDPMLRGDYPRLYRQWLTNAFIKKDWHCIIFSENQMPIGLCVFSRDTENAGHIELLTVTENFQRKKIGQTLLQVSENMLIRTYGISKMFVKTQETNIPACRCYQKIGYVPCKKEHISHLWIEK